MFHHFLSKGKKKKSGHLTPLFNTALMKAFDLQDADVSVAK